MHKRIIDITGKKFGRLFVIKFVGVIRRVSMWECLCDCGNIKNIAGIDLRSGHTTSCGCYLKEIRGKHSITHGDLINNKRSPEYEAWLNLRRRCFDSTNKRFPNYGGRGVTVCPQWLGKDGFKNFLSYIGRRPSSKHSVDRFPNKNGNYEPGNVRWATMRQQCSNRTTNVWYEAEGKRMIRQDWLRHFNVHDLTFCRLMKRHNKNFEIVYNILKTGKYGKRS